MRHRVEGFAGAILPKMYAETLRNDYVTLDCTDHKIHLARIMGQAGVQWEGSEDFQICRKETVNVIRSDTRIGHVRTICVTIDVGKDFDVVLEISPEGK